MKLFIVHCGFYDRRINAGTLESHTNFFIAAPDAKGARAKVKELPAFRELKMHVDVLQEVIAVEGHEISLRKSQKHQGKTIIKQQKIGSRIAVETTL